MPCNGSPASWKIIWCFTSAIWWRDVSRPTADFSATKENPAFTASHEQSSDLGHQQRLYSSLLLRRYLRASVVTRKAGYGDATEVFPRVNTVRPRGAAVTEDCACCPRCRVWRRGFQSRFPRDLILTERAVTVNLYDTHILTSFLLNTWKAALQILCSFSSDIRTHRQASCGVTKLKCEECHQRRHLRSVVVLGWSCVRRT